MQDLPVQGSPVRVNPVLIQKNPGSGDFGAVFGGTAIAPMRCERAQTGAFLAATGAVCEDGVELVCVQLLAGEQNLYTGS